MSSLALMRWLESAPDRYDRGMRWLTFGRVGALHEAVALAAVAAPGARVLEVGCGTGAVTQRLLARGARVLAIDQDPRMLDQTRERVARSGPPGAALELRETTAAEIDRLGSDFDAVVLCLCLSDMSPDERAFVLRASAGRLRPGGRVVAGDEVHASGRAARWLQRLWRAPQAAAGWLLVGSVSNPVPDLAGELRAAGFRIEKQQRWLMGTLACVEAVAP